MPGLFVAYFAYRKQFFSASLVLFWVGESVLNVSVYAGDSLALQLPLLGGQDSIHYWNYMLSEVNLLPATAKIEGGIRVLGTVTILLAGLGSCFIRPRRNRLLTHLFRRSSGRRNTTAPPSSSTSKPWTTRSGRWNFLGR
jgi:hypothetical protein